MTEETSVSAGQPIAAPGTRRFRCEVIERDAAAAGTAEAPRLELVAIAPGEARLNINVSSAEVKAVRQELFDRGYRRGLSCCGGSVGYGSWRGYLNELDAAHIVVEMLGWTLSPEEQRALDAVDEYGRRAPTGMSSSFLM
jgi:hypothetical protein